MKIIFLLVGFFLMFSHLCFGLNSATEKVATNIEIQNNLVEKIIKPDDNKPKKTILPMSKAAIRTRMFALISLMLLLASIAIIFVSASATIPILAILAIVGSVVCAIVSLVHSAIAFGELNTKPKKRGHGANFFGTMLSIFTLVLNLIKLK